MNFLLEYTNPALESVSDAFAISGAHGDSVAVLDAQLFGAANFVNDALMTDLFSDIFPQDHTEASNPLLNGPSDILGFSSTESLQGRADELVLLLEAQYHTAPSSFPLLVQQFPTGLAKVVFTSDNITTYASAFFTFFHPHTPFLHRPSVDLGTIPLYLLLAISLLGSVFATPTDDALSARCFFSLGEEHIFGLLQQLIDRETTSSDDEVSLVQAAVLMHALQVNSNHDGVRHRIRVHRFPDIVAAVRKLGLFDMTCSRLGDQSRWEDYMYDEVKIRYYYHSTEAFCEID